MFLGDIKSPKQQNEKSPAKSSKKKKEVIEKEIGENRKKRNLLPFCETSGSEEQIYDSQNIFDGFNIPIKFENLHHSGTAY